MIGYSGKGILDGFRVDEGQMAVGSYGKMVSSGIFIHIELSQINEVAIIEVWQNPPEFIRFRKRYTIPLTKFE